jgi:general secretion pathway protein D
VKRLAQFLSIVALVIFFSRPASADAILNFNVPTGPVGVGSTISIPVEVSGAADLYAFQFDVSYNPSVLQLLSISEGSFLSSAGSTFFIPGSIDNSSGIASFNADTLIGLGPGAFGNGDLLDLGFQVTSPGSSNLTLSNVILLDSQLADISFETESGYFSTTASAVPEPNLFWLLTAAAACLFLRTKSLRYSHHTQ